MVVTAGPKVALWPYRWPRVSWFFSCAYNFPSHISQMWDMYSFSVLKLPLFMLKHTWWTCRGHPNYTLMLFHYLAFLLLFVAFWRRRHKGKIEMKSYTCFGDLALSTRLSSITCTRERSSSSTVLFLQGERWSEQSSSCSGYVVNGLTVLLHWHRLWGDAFKVPRVKTVCSQIIIVLKVKTLSSTLKFLALQHTCKVCFQQKWILQLINWW